jgi:hypothetical protein
VIFGQLILDLPHGAAHGVEVSCSGSCRRYCSDSVSTTSAARGCTRVAKGRVHGGLLWMLAKIAHAAIAELLGLTAPSPSHLLSPSVVLQSRS